MIHRIIIFIALLLSIGQATGANGTDRKIADAVDSADWLALDSLRSCLPHDSISPMLEVYSRCMTGFWLNRPDEALGGFRELFATHGSSLTPDMKLRSGVMFAMALSREGLNEAAHVTVDHLINDTVIPPADKATLCELHELAERYGALAAHTPYSIGFPASERAVIPFTLMNDGTGQDKGPLTMTSDVAAINGAPVRVVFNTGSAFNIVTDSLASVLDLTPVGGNTSGPHLCMARRLSLGDITVTDVPFMVIPSASGTLMRNCPMLGSELLVRLKDITIDFVNNTITVATSPARRTSQRPNMCLAPDGTLLTSGRIADRDMLLGIDTGNRGYGTVNLPGTEPDIMPQGIRMDLGGSSVVTPELDAAPAHRTPGGSIGLQGLMMFGKLHFNFTDMTLECHTPRISLNDFCKHKSTDIFNVPGSVIYRTVPQPREKESVLSTLAGALVGGAITKLLIPSSDYWDNVSDFLSD